MASGATVLADLRVKHVAKLYAIFQVCAKYDPTDISLRFHHDGLHVYVRDYGDTIVAHLHIDKHEIIADAETNLYVFTREVHVTLDLKVLLDVIGTNQKEDSLRLQVRRNANTAYNVVRVILSHNNGRRNQVDISTQSCDVLAMQFPEMTGRGALTATLASGDLHEALKGLSPAFDSTGSRVDASHNSNSFILFVPPDRSSLSFQAVGVTTRIQYSLPCTFESLDPSASSAAAAAANTDPVHDAIRHLTVLTFLRYTRISAKIRVTIAPGLPLLLVYCMEGLGEFSLYVAPTDCLDDDDKAKHRTMMAPTDMPQQQPQQQHPRPHQQPQPPNLKEDLLGRIRTALDARAADPRGVIERVLRLGG